LSEIKYLEDRAMKKTEEEFLTNIFEKFNENETKLKAAEDENDRMKTALDEVDKCIFEFEEAADKGEISYNAFTKLSEALDARFSNNLE
jgi:uncharacterized protein (UPF0305 family)